MLVARFFILPMLCAIYAAVFYLLHFLESVGNFSERNVLQPFPNSANLSSYRLGNGGGDDDDDDLERIVTEKCNTNDAKACLSGAAIFSSTVCVHSDTSHKIFLSDGRVITRPKNDNVNEGYCTPVTTTKTSDKLSQPPPCNPNTGVRVLRKPNSLAKGFTFFCECKDDRIIGQSIPFVSDCDIPRACPDSGGTLSDEWRDRFATSFDLYRDLKCHCPRGMMSVISSGGVQTCKPKRFVDLSPEEETALYGEIFQKVEYLTVGESEAIDSDFTNVLPPGRKLPNPCSFDCLTGETFSPNQSRLVRSSDGIYYCVSRDQSIVACRKESDYLSRNRGKFANCVIRVSPPKPAKQSFEVIAEYWNKPRDDGEKKNVLPVVGYTHFVDEIFTTADRHNNNLLKLIVLLAASYSKKSGGSKPGPVIRFYNAVVPDTALEAIYPLDRKFSKDLTIRELGEAGLPYLSHNILTFTVPIPVKCENHIIDTKECSKIGKLSLEMISNGSFLDFNCTYIGDIVSALYTSYVACSNPSERRLAFVPNTFQSANISEGYDYKFSTLCLSIVVRRNSFFIKSVWLERNEDLAKYLKRLPSLPIGNLWR